MDQLEFMRSKAGARYTDGLPDQVIEQFLAKDISLAMAIKNASDKFRKLDGKETYEKSEEELMAEIVVGWCHLYPQDCRNPYIPLAAKGPWIVTMHGAVLHDNGGYGMLGFGHSPDVVLEAMSEDVVMANIMTASPSQKNFIDAINKEIGHNRGGKCPYKSFLLMNSGSEGNSVADRLIDIHTGNVMEKPEMKGKSVHSIALKGCFHGRTYRPALWTDSCRGAYKKAKAYSINKAHENEYCWFCNVNDPKDLTRLFEKAKAENVFIEAMYMESVMGEGNPGVAITPEFFAHARKLTLDNDAMLLVDNIQAGLRTTGNLSIVDYPGFECLPPPDFEVYSKAINGGQYPVSCLALSERGEAYYRPGVYGNTMTGNPRACNVAAAVLGSITDGMRTNIVEMGKYAVAKYKELQAEFPQLITSVTGTGLLYAVQLNEEAFPVVAAQGAEWILRKQGLGVIHGGHNALRFTPHFKITKDEMDMQVEFIRSLLCRTPLEYFKDLGGRINRMPRTVSERTSSADAIAPGSPKKRVEVTLKGHLFDKNVINTVLDKVEAVKGSANIIELRLGQSEKEETVATVEMFVNSNSAAGLVCEMNNLNCSGIIVK